MDDVPATVYPAKKPATDGVIGTGVNLNEFGLEAQTLLNPVTTEVDDSVAEGGVDPATESDDLPITTVPTQVFEGFHSKNQKVDDDAPITMSARELKETIMKAIYYYADHVKKGLSRRNITGGDDDDDGPDSNILPERKSFLPNKTPRKNVSAVGRIGTKRKTVYPHAIHVQPYRKTTVNMRGKRPVNTSTTLKAVKPGNNPSPRVNVPLKSQIPSPLFRKFFRAPSDSKITRKINLTVSAPASRLKTANAVLRSKPLKNKPSSNARQTLVPSTCPHPPCSNTSVFQQRGEKKTLRICLQPPCNPHRYIRGNFSCPHPPCVIKIKLPKARQKSATVMVKSHVKNEKKDDERLVHARHRILSRRRQRIQKIYNNYINSTGQISTVDNRTFEDYRNRSLKSLSLSDMSDMWRMLHCTDPWYKHRNNEICLDASESVSQERENTQKPEVQVLDSEENEESPETQKKVAASHKKPPKLVRIAFDHGETATYVLHAGNDTMANHEPSTTTQHVEVVQHSTKDTDNAHYSHANGSLGDDRNQPHLVSNDDDNPVRHKTTGKLPKNTAQNNDHTDTTDESSTNKEIDHVASKIQHLADKVERENDRSSATESKNKEDHSLTKYPGHQLAKTLNHADDDDDDEPPPKVTSPIHDESEKPEPNVYSNEKNAEYLLHSTNYNPNAAPQHAPAHIPPEELAHLPVHTSAAHNSTDTSGHTSTVTSPHTITDAPAHTFSSPSTDNSTHVPSDMPAHTTGDTLAHTASTSIHTETVTPPDTSSANLFNSEPSQNPVHQSHNSNRKNNTNVVHYPTPDEEHSPTSTPSHASKVHDSGPIHDEADASDNLKEVLHSAKVKETPLSSTNEREASPASKQKETSIHNETLSPPKHEENNRDEITRTSKPNVSSLLVPNTTNENSIFHRLPDENDDEDDDEPVSQHPSHVLNNPGQSEPTAHTTPPPPQQEQQQHRKPSPKKKEEDKDDHIPTSEEVLKSVLTSPQHKEIVNYALNASSYEGRNITSFYTRAQQLTQYLAEINKTIELNAIAKQREAQIKKDTAEKAELLQVAPGDILRQYTTPPETRRDTYPRMQRRNKIHRRNQIGTYHLRTADDSDDYPKESADKNEKSRYSAEQLQITPNDIHRQYAGEAKVRHMNQRKSDVHEIGVRKDTLVIPLDKAGRLPLSANRSVAVFSINENAHKKTLYKCREPPCVPLREIWKMLRCNHPPCYKNVFSRVTNEMSAGASKQPAEDHAAWTTQHSDPKTRNDSSSNPISGLIKNAPRLSPRLPPPFIAAKNIQAYKITEKARWPKPHVETPKPKQQTRLMDHIGNIWGQVVHPFNHPWRIDKHRNHITVSNFTSFPPTSPVINTINTSPVINTINETVPVAPSNSSAPAVTFPAPPQKPTTFLPIQTPHRIKFYKNYAAKQKLKKSHPIELTKCACLNEPVKRDVMDTLPPSWSMKKCFCPSSGGKKKNEQSTRQLPAPHMVAAEVSLKTPSPPDLSRMNVLYNVTPVSLEINKVGKMKMEPSVPMKKQVSNPQLLKIISDMTKTSKQLNWQPLVSAINSKKPFVIIEVHNKTQGEKNNQAVGKGKLPRPPVPLLAAGVIHRSDALQQLHPPTPHVVQPVPLKQTPDLRAGTIIQNVESSADSDTTTTYNIHSSHSDLGNRDEDYGNNEMYHSSYVVMTTPTLRSGIEPQNISLSDTTKTAFGQYLQNLQSHNNQKESELLSKVAKLIKAKKGEGPEEDYVYDRAHLVTTRGSAIELGPQNVSVKYVYKGPNWIESHETIFPAENITTRSKIPAAPVFVSSSKADEGIGFAVQDNKIPPKDVGRAEGKRRAGVGGKGTLVTITKPGDDISPEAFDNTPVFKMAKVEKDRMLPQRARVPGNLHKNAMKPQPVRRPVVTPQAAKIANQRNALRRSQLPNAHAALPQRAPVPLRMVQAAVKHRIIPQISLLPNVDQKATITQASVRRIAPQSGPAQIARIHWKLIPTTKVVARAVAKSVAAARPIPTKKKVVDRAVAKSVAAVKPIPTKKKVVDRAVAKSVAAKPIAAYSKYVNELKKQKKAEEAALLKDVLDTIKRKKSAALNADPTKYIYEGLEWIEVHNVKSRGSIGVGTKKYAQATPSSRSGAKAAAPIARFKSFAAKKGVPPPKARKSFNFAMVRVGPGQKGLFPNPKSRRADILGFNKKTKKSKSIYTLMEFGEPIML